MTTATQGSRFSQFKRVEKSIFSLWQAFRELYLMDPEALTDADAHLWFEVTKHPAIQQRLSHALEQENHE